MTPHAWRNYSRGRGSWAPSLHPEMEQEQAAALQRTMASRRSQSLGMRKMLLFAPCPPLLSVLLFVSSSSLCSPSSPASYCLLPLLLMLPMTPLPHPPLLSVLPSSPCSRFLSFPAPHLPLIPSSLSSQFSSRSPSSPCYPDPLVLHAFCLLHPFHHSPATPSSPVLLVLPVSHLLLQPQHLLTNSPL